MSFRLLSNGDETNTTVNIQPGDSNGVLKVPNPHGNFKYSVQVIVGSRESPIMPFKFYGEEGKYKCNILSLREMLILFPSLVPNF